MNKFVVVVKTNLFVHFLGEFEDTESSFEIISPLVCRDKKMHQLFANEIQVAKNAQNKSIAKAKIYILSKIKNMLKLCHFAYFSLFLSPKKYTLKPTLKMKIPKSNQM